MRMIGIVVLAAGGLALAYAEVSDARQARQVTVDTLEVSASERHRVDVLAWAGVMLAVVGGGLLIGGKKSR